MIDDNPFFKWSALFVPFMVETQGDFKHGVCLVCRCFRVFGFRVALIGALRA